MPTAQSANTITIASRINTVIIKALLVHAILASGVMIGLQSQHTQGASPMKDKKRRHRLTWRGGLIGTLLPMALATSRSEEHTSELQSLMRISYAVFCLKKKKKQNATQTRRTQIG